MRRSRLEILKFAKRSPQDKDKTGKQLCMIAFMHMTSGMFIMLLRYIAGQQLIAHLNDIRWMRCSTSPSLGSPSSTMVCSHFSFFPIALTV